MTNEEIVINAELDIKKILKEYRIDEKYATFWFNRRIDEKNQYADTMAVVGHNRNLADLIYSSLKSDPKKYTFFLFGVATYLGDNEDALNVFNDAINLIKIIKQESNVNK